MAKSKRKKIFLIILFTFLSIILISVGVLWYLSQTNKYVKMYFEFPTEVKTRSIGLGLSVARNYVFPYDVKQEFVDEVTEEQLLKSVRLGANWIMEMQENGGRFNYWYNPDLNTLSEPNDDNFLRQAGTCYSLCVAAEATGDSSYLIAAKRNMRYLLGYKMFMEDDKAYFLFRRKAKLGGIALPMLAMLKMKELTQTDEYDEILGKLANMIIYLQDAYGTGQFKSTYVYRGDYNRQWHSEIYPGEAMYALSEMYKTFGKEVYKERLDSAARFYDSPRYWGKSAFMPWTISALSNMYMITGDDYYLDYAKKISDRMILTQNLNPRLGDYGSWNPVPMVNSSTCMEALGDLVEALHKAGNEEEWKYYRDHAIIGYRWLMEFQFGFEDMEGIKQPHYALGGFPSSSFKREIRIDNTQHSITALAKGALYVYTDK